MTRTDVLKRSCLSLLFVCFVTAAYVSCGGGKVRQTSHDCDNDLGPTADRIQAQLESSNYPLPPRILRSTATPRIQALEMELFKNNDWSTRPAEAEVVYEKQRAKILEEDQALVDTILSKGALNDAALCLWNAAELAVASGDLVQGRLAYLKVQRYTYALAISGRTHGVFSTTRETIASNFATHQLEFWSPAYQAAMQLITRSGEVPCSGCGRGGIIQHFIAPLRDRFSDTHFPHLTAKIIEPLYGQTAAREITVKGTIAEIPEEVYKDPEFFGRWMPNEEFNRLHQTQLYRLTDDTVTVTIGPGLSLYVITKIDSADSPYFAHKADVTNKAWTAQLSLQKDPKAPPAIVEIIAAVAFRELPKQFDSLPEDIWPVSWTRIKTQ